MVDIKKSIGQDLAGEKLFDTLTTRKGVSRSIKSFKNFRNKAMKPVGVNNINIFDIKTNEQMDSINAENQVKDLKDLYKSIYKSDDQEISEILVLLIFKNLDKREFGG